VVLAGTSQDQKGAGVTVIISVSDPHTLNADPDPDPGLKLNTDPGSGSWIPDPGSQLQILIKHKKIFLQSFLRVHSSNTGTLLLNHMLSSEKLF